MQRRSPRSWVLFGALCGLGFACGGRAASDTVPTAALAGTRSAQEAFRPLRQRFVGSDRAQRALLEPNLSWFVAAYPRDGLADLARVYLGLIAVDRGNVEKAREVTRGVADRQSGTTRDLADLLDGVVLLQQKQVTLALERFMPLVGKLIDPYARMLLDEYIVAAALAGQRWYEAVAYMDLWLREAQEDAPAVRALVRRRLESVPVEALELMLQAMRSEQARAGYGADIRKAVVARLAAVALDQQDTNLARRLVESSGTSQVLGEAAEGLEELASSGGAAVVDGRTIGLLVSTGATELGRRAAEVVTGMVDAVRVAGEAGKSVRLATRDERDPKRTELALLALAAQGASILVAGVDPQQAEVAANFALKSKLPVILLSALPDRREPQPPAFVLGESSERIAVVLTAALAAYGARSVAPVGGAPAASAKHVAFTSPASCRGEPSESPSSRFPIDVWREAKIDHLLLLGDALCASDAIAATFTDKLGVARAAVGLDGADLAAEWNRLPLLLATTGKFPLRRADTGGPLAAFRKRQGRAPTFWAALGHDAAALATAAAQTMPPGRTEDAREVEARHDTAIQAVSNAQADLWTTSARGFAGRTVIERDIVVVEVR